MRPLVEPDGAASSASQGVGTRPLRRALRRAPGLGWLLASLSGLWAVGLAACGLGAGRAPSAVQLTVTRDFGARPLHTWRAPHVRGKETVMSLLMRNAKVATRYGGGFVQSIDGLAGGSEGGEPVDWFYYVNGVEAHEGAAERNVRAGDRIWWDRHDWSQTDDVPAVVGSFPEPFLNGLEGKRLPVRVDCVNVGSTACTTVTARLRAAGVPAAIAGIGAGGGPQTLRVLVGPAAPLLAGEASARVLAGGPSASGVYARLAANGAALELLDPDGRGVRTLRAGSGLIAATRTEQAAPEWVVTGTDKAGVERAAAAFGTPALRDRFALAVARSGQPLALPQVGT
jgi:hypothetical protein